jgi:hypothetical protein
MFEELAEYVDPGLLVILGLKVYLKDPDDCRKFMKWAYGESYIEDGDVHLTEDYLHKDKYPAEGLLIYDGLLCMLKGFHEENPEVDMGEEPEFTLEFLDNDLGLKKSLMAYLKKLIEKAAEDHAAQNPDSKD